MMTENLSFLIAFAAGVLSFLSPCTLPLIPSYLSFIGGTSFKDLQDQKVARSHILLRTLLFVLGFSILFIALGVIFSGTGLFLSSAGQIINIVAGILVMVLGLNFIFDFWKILNVEKRLHISEKPSSLFGSVLLGMAFGAGWTPCVGPILASILFLAGSSGRVLQGTLLLSVYSLGLGLPFILAGLFFSSFMKSSKKLKPHLNTIRIVSGVFLVFIGLFILLGRLQRVNIFLFRLAGNLDQWGQIAPLQVQLFFGLLFILPALLVAFFYLKKAKVEKKYPFRPLPFAFFLTFLLISVLSFTGAITPSRFFTFWFTFQGI